MERWSQPVQGPDPLGMAGIDIGASCLSVFPVTWESPKKQKQKQTKTPGSSLQWLECSLFIWRPGQLWLWLPPVSVGPRGVLLCHQLKL